MKLVSLNVFGGRFFEPLMSFIAQHAPDTDIFCFQEVVHAPTPVTNDRQWRANLCNELVHALPQFECIFYESRTQDLTDEHGTVIAAPFGKLTCVNKKYTVLNHAQHFIHGTAADAAQVKDFSKPNSLVHVELAVNGRSLHILNTHAMPFPGDKLDSPERIAQSHKILAVATALSGAKIMCGDFNLLPHTQSIAMIREQQYRNLITEYHVSSTRGTLCKQINPQYENTPEGHQAFADYTFVSPAIHVKNFFVPDVPISDHLPMILEFEI